MILANIDSFTITDLAPYLAGALATQGRLVVSGISEHLAGACRIALENAGLQALETASRDGWCALICTKS
jgi:ribosomal protein L11 methylase PrmA